MTLGSIEMIAGPTLMPDAAPCPTVSVTYLRGVLDFAVTRGVRRAALLVRTGLRERACTSMTRACRSIA